MLTSKQLGIGCIILLATLSAPASLNEDPFAPIPSSLRPRLIERFNSLIEFRRTQQWDNLYDLIAIQYRRNHSKQEFVLNAQKYPGAAGTGRRLIAFAPKDVRLANGSDHDWVVSGCATLAGFRFPIDAFVMANRENDDWYFSDLDAFVPRDTPWRPCSFLKTRHARGRNVRHSNG